MLANVISFNDGLRAITNEVVERKQAGTILVAIAGGSCSGKSYFADKLSKELNDRAVKHALVGLDSYFRDNDDPLLPTGNRGQLLYDVPGSYDQLAISKDLQALLEGVSVDCRVFDMASNKRSTTTVNKQQANGVAIAEGLYAISQVETVTAQTKVLVYVDAPTTTRLDRRAKRDMAKYGVSMQAVERLFWEVIEPAYRQYNILQKAKADFVISSV